MKELLVSELTALTCKVSTLIDVQRKYKAI